MKTSPILGTDTSESAVWGGITLLEKTNAVKGMK
jgi:hypothetical protein